MTVRMAAGMFALVFAASNLAGASVMNYPTSGKPAASVNLTAASTGAIQGYFLGQSANDLDSIALLDLTTNVQSAFFFPNHTTAAGTTANFGTVNAGDSIVFLLFNAKKGTTLRSDDSNTDGFAHAYLSSFAGGMIGGINYPTSTFVGFEDLLAPSTDFDYNDNMFLFTNVAGTTPPSAVPEPGGLALLGTGALGAFGILRRRVTRG